MPLQSRPYTDNDLPHLQETLAHWVSDAGDCGYYHIGNLAHWIYAILRERRPIGELVQVWEDDAGIAGIAINFLFDTAFQLFVRPAYRGTGAERTMLQSAFETTQRLIRSTGQSNTLVMTDVFSCDSIRIKALEQLGFTRYRLWDHITERSLSEPIPEVRLPEGFLIRCAADADYPQLASVRNDAFNNDWTAEQYRAMVMHKPGYQPEREIIVVAPDAQIAAFTVIHVDPVNKLGLFEPVGTRPAFQRRGLARAMMLYAMHEMKRQGMQAALVEHDATNTAALELYRSIGFQKKYETLGYTRSI